MGAIAGTFTARAWPCPRALALAAGGALTNRLTTDVAGAVGAGADTVRRTTRVRVCGWTGCVFDAGSGRCTTRSRGVEPSAGANSTFWIGFELRVSATAGRSADTRPAPSAGKSGVGPLWISAPGSRKAESEIVATASVAATIGDAEATDGFISVAIGNCRQLAECDIIKRTEEPANPPPLLPKSPRTPDEPACGMSPELGATAVPGDRGSDHCSKQHRGQQQNRPQGRGDEGVSG